MILRFSCPKIRSILFFLMTFHFMTSATAFAFSLPDPTGEKAKAFNEIFRFVATDQVYEDTIFLKRLTGTYFSRETALEMLNSQIAYKIREKYEARVYASNLGLTPDTFCLSARSIPLEKISETSGKQERWGKISPYIKASFREKRINPDTFNPFIEKKIKVAPPVIEKCIYVENHWEIEATGYSYYESAADIDHKASIAATLARDTLFNFITQKALALGAVTPANEKTFLHELFLKKHAGGIYDPTGCGIYFEKSVAVWIDDNGHILDELTDKK